MLEVIDLSHVPYRRFFSLVCTDVLDNSTLSPAYRRSEKELHREVSKQSIEPSATTEQTKIAAESDTSRNEGPRETDETLPVTVIKKPAQKGPPFIAAWKSLKQQIVLVFLPKYHHCVILGIGVLTVALLCALTYWHPTR